MAGNAVNIDDLTSTVFICDNLPFLKAIPSESIDLVCIDPPFGKKQTFVGTLVKPLSKDELRIEKELLQSWGVTDPDSAYEAGLEWPDQEGTTAKFEEIWNFSRHVYAGWIEQLELVNPGLDFLIKSIRYTQNNGIAAYIAFMAERMFQIKRILKPTGSVYLHCDNEANGYLRQMLDAVFGKANFRNEIIWERHTSTQRGSQHTPKSWGNTLDTILFYAKSRQATVEPWRPLTPQEREKNLIASTKMDAGTTTIAPIFGELQIWELGPTFVILGKRKVIPLPIPIPAAGVWKGSVWRRNTAKATLSSCPMGDCNAASTRMIGGELLPAACGMILTR